MSWINFVEDVPEMFMDWLKFNEERKARNKMTFTRVWKKSRRVRIPLRYPFHTIRKLPSFVGIGEQKCGTSSLFHYFARNPELDRPMMKEVHFFGRKTRLRMNHGRSEAVYRSYFPLNINDKPTFEVTPGYLSWPDAPKEMHDMMPDIKLVVLVREPVSRFWSGYHMGVRGGVESRPPMDIINLYPEEEWTIGRHVERGEYAKNLAQWTEQYDREQILVVKSEDLREWSWATMKDIYDFLDVEWSPPTNREWNVAKYDRVIPDDVREALDEHYGPHNDRLKEEWNISW